MPKLVLFIYNLFFPILFTCYLPIFLRKLTKRGNYKVGFLERFGIYSGEKKKRLRRLHRPIWIHAVSVGETVAALTFVATWKKRAPNATFVISTTTSTGQMIARKHESEYLASIYFPIDFRLFSNWALSTVDPEMLIIFEVEIWPNIITLAKKRRIPTALANCRMSNRSAAGYRRYRRFFREIFLNFDVICTQTEQDKQAVMEVVEDHASIHVCNTMKFDQLPDIAGGDAADLISRVFPEPERILFSAASTHAGEELVMARMLRSLSIQFPNLRLALIPRHVERTPDIEIIFNEQEIPYVLLTTLRQESSRTGGADAAASSPRALIVDTTGEMLGFLGASDIVFVGKSLAGNTGGHNIIEPALFGKPIIIGKNMENFRVVVDIFKANDACIEVGNESELVDAVRALILDPEKRRRLSERSRQTVERNRGAIVKTIELLETIRIKDSDHEF